MWILDLVCLEVGILGTIHGIDNITCDGGGLEEGVDVVGWIIVVKVHSGNHDLGFAPVRRIGVVNGRVFGAGVHTSFPLYRRPIGAVTQVLTLTVEVIEFYHGDILFSSWWSPAVA